MFFKNITIRKKMIVIGIVLTISIFSILIFSYKMMEKLEAHSEQINSIGNKVFILQKFKLEQKQLLLDMLYYLTDEKKFHPVHDTNNSLFEKSYNKFIQLNGYKFEKLIPIPIKT